MGLVGFQVNLPQRNAELFGIFDFRSVVRCGKPMGGRKSEKIFDRNGANQRNLLEKHGGAKRSSSFYNFYRSFSHIIIFFGANISNCV